MMKRQITNRTSGMKAGLILGTAMVSFALTGCTVNAAAPAQTSAAKAEEALAKGQVDKAVSFAEEAVLAEPRNAAHRAMLGAAYMESGRFASAAQSFSDALELGDSDPRTVLSYALAKTATGDNASAIAMLERWENMIPAADYGLAIALAGNPERGVHVLTNAIRSGQNSAKTRQNLAYTYALAGNWRAARVMASEDVPADQLDARLSDWATKARPEDYQLRVAGLLNVQPRADYGMPAQLALRNNPSDAQLFAEAAAQAPEDAPAVVAFAEPEPAPAPVVVAKVEKATVAPVEKPKPAPVRVAAAPTPAAEPVKPGIRYVSNPVVQQVPSAPSRSSARAVTRTASSSAVSNTAYTKSGADTHLVQLGSYDSRAVAEAGWSKLKKRYPNLAAHDVVITKAEVKGKTYYRLAASGFGLGDARAMCNTVRKSGSGCFAYAKTNPPSGAVDTVVRIAARTR